MIISVAGGVSYWWLYHRRGRDLPPTVEPVLGSKL
jgi:hypothetical protein